MTNSLMARVANEEEASPKTLEQAIYRLGAFYSRTGRASELAELTTAIRAVFHLLPKAKAAKIVRTLIDEISKIDDTVSLQIEVCKDCITWAASQNRKYLKQRVEARLAALHLKGKQYGEALDVLSPLVKEVRKLDDKPVLLELHLLSSQVYYAVKNLPKAKGSLTAARTCASAVYVAPRLQAELDLQAGIVLTEEGDYKTAYSYFYESFENFSQLDDSRASSCLKYMMLSKLMLGSYDDVHSLVTSKMGLKYTGKDIAALREITAAYTSRSVKSFQQALDLYPEELVNDELVSARLGDLHSALLEANLLRIVEPYSAVELDHIASLIELPTKEVTSKLSQMILDRALYGTLDQGAGTLLVFDAPEDGQLYDTALKTVDSMQTAVNVMASRFFG